MNNEEINVFDTIANYLVEYMIFFDVGDIFCISKEVFFVKDDGKINLFSN